jgi:hypothetical protein
VPDMMAVNATWYRRSSLRSELREIRIIAARPARLGIVNKSPASLLELRFGSDFNNCGAHEVRALDRRAFATTGGDNVSHQVDALTFVPESRPSGF